MARDALEGKGPQRPPQKRLDRRLEEVAKAVGGGYCRLPMPLKLALGVRENVAGHRLGALQRGYLPLFQSIPGGGDVVCAPRRREGGSGVQMWRRGRPWRGQWWGVRIPTSTPPPPPCPVCSAFAGPCDTKAKFTFFNRALDSHPVASKSSKTCSSYHDSCLEGGRESLEGGGTPSPLPHCTNFTPKAFPYPNTSPNRISNRQ